jgi:hypothetical protein
MLSCGWAGFWLFCRQQGEDGPSIWEMSVKMSDLSPNNPSKLRAIEVLRLIIVFPVSVCLFIISMAVFSVIVTKLFGVSSSAYFWIVAVATGVSVITGALIAPTRFQTKTAYVLTTALVTFTLGSLFFDAVRGKATMQNFFDVVGVILGFVVVVRPFLKRTPATRIAPSGFPLPRE